jgi:hypothetical protein
LIGTIGCDLFASPAKTTKAQLYVMVSSAATRTWGLPPAVLLALAPSTKAAEFNILALDHYVVRSGCVAVVHFSAITISQLHQEVPPELRERTF